MIRGVHTMFYSSEPEALRAFLRDKLGFNANDVGDGWLIFDIPEADMGCHPADEEGGAPSGTHNISFYCDDVERTVRELQARGVEFTGPVEDHGYGLVTHFKAPGHFEVQLYQPKYVKPAPARRPLFVMPRRDSVVSLREVTKDNLQEVLWLKVRNDQLNLVALNSVSIAQAHFEGEAAWFRAIYADETPVGFMMLEDRPEKPMYYLWRFMIDARFQHLGFGSGAAQRLI